MLGLGTKKVWELASKIVFPLPSCFLFGVGAPLNFIELDLAPSGKTNVFIENLDGRLTISQVFVQVDGKVIDVLEDIQVVGDF